MFFKRAEQLPALLCLHTMFLGQEESSAYFLPFSSQFKKYKGGLLCTFFKS